MKSSVTASIAMVMGIYSVALNVETLYAQGSDYLVIDVSSGASATNYPITFRTTVPVGGWTEEYKTTKMVLRRIPAGTFTMGSPGDELGHRDDETQHQVTLTQPLYVGVFEVTQRQWERVMGTWQPCYFTNTTCRDTRPVEQVSYNDIRGSTAGAGWPANYEVDTGSFMGRLRARTGRTFDLPTESQWEYAARACTTTALNSGHNLTNAEVDAHLDLLGRYAYNGGVAQSGNRNADTSAGTAEVGSYMPNAWGLYDTHGNVWELCLDWYGPYPGTVNDPRGRTSGPDRTMRGGNVEFNASGCRIAFRSYTWTDTRGMTVGFRIALPATAFRLLPDYQYDGSRGRAVIEGARVLGDNRFSFVCANADVGIRCLVSWTRNLLEWFPLIDFDASTHGTEVTDLITTPQAFYKTTYLPTGVLPAYDFDYPIGNGGYDENGIPITSDGIPEQISPERNDLYPSRPTNNPVRRTISPTAAWRNAQDVGSYYAEMGGLHAGEDWDKGLNVGESVRAVANGKVIDIRPEYADETRAGYAMVIRHWVLNGDSVDSVYGHIAPDKIGGVTNLTGTIGQVSEFTYQKGTPVTKGTIIGVIGAITEYGPHLHFEMRNKPFNPSGRLWINDIGNGYYGSQPGSAGSCSPTMETNEVSAAFKLMLDDGIIDPSDFIDDHRNPQN